MWSEYFITKQLFSIHANSEEPKYSLTDGSEIYYSFTEARNKKLRNDIKCTLRTTSTKYV